jgi:hypothetical protein
LLVSATKIATLINAIFVTPKTRSQLLTSTGLTSNFQ